MSASNQLLFKQETQPIIQSGPGPCSVRTNTEGWQVACWDLAKTNRRFYVHGYKKPHKTFIEELAFTYEYHLEMVGKKVVFHPGAAPNQARP
jgi:hypothetical protein